MKKRMVIILLLSPAVLWAMQFNMKKSYRDTLLAAFIAQDHTHVAITITGTGENDGYSAQIDIGPHLMTQQDPNENDQLYLKRRVGLIVDAFVKAHEKKLKQDAVKTYLESAPGLDVNEPDGIDE